ncbi:ATPase [Aquicoccus sp. SCR17]|nr:ATPase [Carideicomes alvinocaridis]
MSFDWTTFALQVINLLVLLAILRHFLFRPVAAMIETRRAETRAALDAASAAKTEAEAAAARAAQEAKASAAARSAVLEKAETEAETRSAAIIAKARAEADKIEAEGRAARAREDSAAAAQALARAQDLALAIARRMLAERPDGPHGYAARLTEALEKMEAAEREALLGGSDLTLVSATALPDNVLDGPRAALKAYGATAGVSTDPDLIEGLELRSGSGVLRNSLAHDLETLGRAMQDDRSAA